MDQKALEALNNSTGIEPEEPATLKQADTEDDAQGIDFVKEFNEIRDLQKMFQYLKYERKRLKNMILQAEYEKLCRKLDEPNVYELNNHPGYL